MILRVLRRGGVLVAALFGGTIAGVSIASWVESVFGDIALEAPPLFMLIPMLLIIALFSMLMHELGHVLGGRLAGLKFVMLIVGPLKVLNEDSRLVFGLNRWWQMAGGLALCVPRLHKTSAGALFSYIAGGPLVSLAMAALCMFTAVLIHNASESVGGGLLFYILCTAFFNGGIAIVTLIPLPSEGHENDGKQLFDLLRRGQSVRVKLLLSAISAEAMDGVRPKQWNTAYVQQLMTITDEMPNRNAVAAGLMGYYHYLDKGDIERAGMCVERMADHLDIAPPFMKPSLWLEMMFYASRYGFAGLPAEANSALAKGPFVEKHSLARLEAALHLQNLEYEKAMDAAMEGIAIAGYVTHQVGIAAAEVSWMQAITEVCMQARREVGG